MLTKEGLQYFSYPLENCFKV